MPKNPRDQQNSAFQMSAEEYRRLQNARAEKRRKRQRQRIMVLGAFVLAAILLILCVVLVIRSIFTKKDDTSTPSGTTDATSFAELQSWDETPAYPTAADTTVWNLKLVNENNRLAADFQLDVELDTVVEGVVPYYFDPRIVDSLKQMIQDCNAVEGNSLAVRSGFRSYDRQQKYFDYEISLLNNSSLSDEEKEAQVKRYEATAGASDHHTGLAVKFVTNNVTEFEEAFATTSEYQWLVDNAANYGFILRYPGEKSAITGMDYLPYHWRYVGVEDAKIMNDAGVCLEEYVSAVAPGTFASEGSTPDDPDDAGEGGGAEGQEDDAPESGGEDG